MFRRKTQKTPTATADLLDAATRRVEGIAAEISELSGRLQQTESQLADAYAANDSDRVIQDLQRERETIDAQLQRLRADHKAAEVGLKRATKTAAEELFAQEIQDLEQRFETVGRRLQQLFPLVLKYWREWAAAGKAHNDLRRRVEAFKREHGHGPQMPDSLDCAGILPNVFDAFRELAFTLAPMLRPPTRTEPEPLPPDPSIIRWSSRWPAIRHPMLRNIPDEEGDHSGE